MPIQRKSLGPSGPSRPATWIGRVLRLLLGPPIPSSEQDEARLPKLLALPIFSSDAISSVAYATQEILLALGVAGLAAASQHQTYARYAWGVALAIVFLLVIVAASYRQTIFAYPSGGGSYIVSRENLGVQIGLIAAAALLIDYVLTVAVSIASGVQNLLATPALSAHTRDQVAVCLIFVMLLTLANLRGLKQAGALFAMPTYLFIGLAYLMVVLGGFGAYLGWPVHPETVNQSVPRGYRATSAAGSIALFVILRAFANGCSAMTGTEAISNGIPAFQKPESPNAAKTLFAMAFILGSLFVGITWLATGFHVVYWEQGGRTAPAVIDQLSGAVFGRRGAWAWLYYATQFATAGILVLAANTSFADFPRLASILARDRYLPTQLASRGDRLVFSGGILLLGFFSALLLVTFKGSVDRLIPLYALGVFTAFTLSQSGMVRHWLRERGSGWLLKAVINGVGAAATAVVFLVILIEKFPQGAWIVVIVAVALIGMFNVIHAQYEQIRRRVGPRGSVAIESPGSNAVLVLVGGAHLGMVPALRYAKGISSEFQAVYVEIDPETAEERERAWEATFPEVPLVVLESPYRSIIGPLKAYIDEIRGDHRADIVTVIIPESFSDAWWDLLLHHNTGALLKLALLGRDDVVVTNVRYHIESSPVELEQGRVGD